MKNCCAPSDRFRKQKDIPQDICMKRRGDMYTVKAKRLERHRERDWNYLKRRATEEY